MNLNDLSLFVSVVDAGGFTAAANELGVAKSTVSERIQALESTLGTSLLLRTTRSVTPTDAGEALVERAREILALAADAENAVGASTRTARGRLRVSAPISFGLRFLSDVFADLHAKHPELELDAVLDDRDVDLVRDGIDVAIRIGNLSDSSLRAKRIGVQRRLVVASPAYIAQRGRPERPEDMASHDCLLYAYQRGGATWQLSDDGGGTKRVPVSGRLRCNNGDALVEFATRGLGLAWLPEFIVQPFVDDGRLVSLLEPYCRSVVPVQLVFPERVFRTHKERVFVEALEHKFSQSPENLG